jgi:hypothetical protein
MSIEPLTTMSKLESTLVGENDLLTRWVSLVLHLSNQLRKKIAGCAMKERHSNHFSRKKRYEIEDPLALGSVAMVPCW